MKPIRFSVAKRNFLHRYFVVIIVTNRSRICSDVTPRRIMPEFLIERINFALYLHSVLINRSFIGIGFYSIDLNVFFFLKRLVSQEDRLIRVLTHYYQVQEILLPYESPPATLPQKLFDFYNALVDEMKMSSMTQRHSPERINDNEEMMDREDFSADDKKIIPVEESSISRLSKSSKSRKSLKKLPQSRSYTVASSEQNLSTVMSSGFDTFRARNSQDDPDEIESLLHSEKSLGLINLHDCCLRHKSRLSNVKKIDCPLTVSFFAPKLSSMNYKNNQIFVKI